MRLLLTTLLLTCLGSTAATAQDAATSIVKTETQAGQFYSSQLILKLVLVLSGLDIFLAL